MSPTEIAARRTAAAEAILGGENGRAYWRDLPQLNTVGYLTTVAGAMIGGYAIGCITGRFAPPFRRLQFDLSSPEIAKRPTPP